MAGRFSVEGTFRMVDRMTRPIQRIEARLNRFVRGAQSGFRGIQEFVGITRGAFLALGAAIVAASAAAVHALHEVIQTGMEFDQQLTAAAAKFPGQVRRGTAAYRQLEEAAQRVGRETEFSASQAAEALDFLAMAGFNAEQAVAALPGVVNLATAAQMELGQATDIASDTLGAFGLMSQDAAALGTNLARVNDVLARTSTTSNTTVEQMFEAIRAGGPVAHAAGASIETFSSLLGTLAGSGIKGAEAGTALRNVFLRLQAPTGAARAALRRLHVSTQDAQGNMRDINEILGDLGGSLDGLGTAQRANVLTAIFGNRAVTATNVLLEAGNDRLNEYRTTLEGATGAATEMATTMRDTAGGDLASMNSAIEGLKLGIWELVRGPFRAVLQSVTEWVRANQGDIAGGLRTAVEWLTANMPAIVLWARRIGIAIAVIAAAFVPIAIVMIGTLLLIPALLVGIIVGLQALWDWLSVLAEPVLEQLAQMWQGVRAFFTSVLEFLVGLFIVVGRAVMQALQPAFDAIGAAAAWVRQAWSPVGAFFSGLWSGIADSFTAAGDWIFEDAGSLYDWLVEMWQPLGDFFSGLWDGIAQSFTSTVGGVIDSIGNVVGNIRAVGGGALQGDQAPAPGGGPQVVSPQERVARSVSETTSTQTSEVVVRPADGARAEVRRRPRGSRTNIRVAPSGAM